MSDYLNDYKARMNALGNTISEQQFNSTAYFIESKFKDSPFYRVATIISTEEEIEVRLEDITAITRANTIETLQMTMKYINLKPNNTINIGEVLKIDDFYWIITDFRSDNPLFPKAKIFMCNYELSVPTGTTKIDTGQKDSLGRPVYKTENTYSYPHCFVRSYLANGGLNQAINLPSDTMYITLKYDDVSKNIKEDDIFTLYERTYKVVSIDFSNVIHDIGCISLMVIRTTNTSN